MPTARVRRSLTELQSAYDNGDKAPLETLIRAWKAIKELPPADARSFFKLGGYHGEPFRGARLGLERLLGRLLQSRQHPLPDLASRSTWWSRTRCARSGAAQTSTMPFWDECGDDSLRRGSRGRSPTATFELDGADDREPAEVVPSSRSTIVDNLSGDQSLTTRSPRAMRRSAIRSPAWSARRPTRPRRASTTRSGPTRSGHAAQRQHRHVAHAAVGHGRQSGHPHGGARRVRRMPGRARLHRVLEYDLRRGVERQQRRRASSRWRARTTTSISPSVASTCPSRATSR